MQDSRSAQDNALTDHNYSRQDLLGYYLRPTKTLFTRKSNFSSYNDLDVEQPIQNMPVPYDVNKSRQVMDECEQFVMFARTARLEESSEDWEESISRVGWSVEQHSLFNRAVKILHSDRLARLALQGSWSEPAKRRSTVDRNARRFREVLASVQWDARLTQWLHGLLVEHLDIAYLAAYIDILQTLRIHIPTLIDGLVSSANSGKARIVQEGMKLLLKRPWDPAAKTISSQKLSKLPGNPIIILVPSYLKKKPSLSPRCNLWSSHLSSLANLYTVSPTLGTISSKMTAPAYLEQMVSAAKSRLATARSDHPGQPIILVGWRSGAAVAMQVAATEAVTAVVVMGFATRTVEGPRGDPDDSLFTVNCPALFVAGEESETSRIEDLEEIRMNMMGQTGLVVVSRSDDCLRMRRRHKIEMGITQSLVDRTILEEIGEFLANAIMSPVPPLRPERRLEPTIRRKRRFSTASSVDSEPPPKKESPTKHVRTNLLPAYQKPVNGNVKAPARRGRRAGSGNAMTKAMREARGMASIKTLQTLTPIKKTEVDVNSWGDVTLDVGSVASLAPTGPIVRSGVPQSQATTSTMQTFRIQAGRVSAMMPKAAPPSEVMPRRLSDSQATGSVASDESKHPPIIQNPIRTLDATVQRPNIARAAATVPMRSPRPTIIRPMSRISIGNQSKVVSSPNNVILVSDKRQTAPVAYSPGQSLRLASPLKVVPSKLVKTSTVVKSPTANHLSLEKRFIHTAPSLHQKPIIVSQRSIKSVEESDIKDKPIMIVKNRNLIETDSDKKQFMYVQRAPKQDGDHDRPMVIIKNRAVEADKKQEVVLEPKRSQLLLSQNRANKQVVLKSEGGGQYILQERPSPSPKYIYQYQVEDEESEEMIYEVLES